MLAGSSADAKLGLLMTAFIVPRALTTLVFSNPVRLFRDARGHVLGLRLENLELKDLGTATRVPSGRRKARQN